MYRYIVCVFICVFQSLFSLILSGLSILFFWLSARKETAYNIKKFGDVYSSYMEKVSMWNVFRGVIQAVFKKEHKRLERSH
jgi:protein-S-isoprenylcysteine O-methyltransferase Ste14